MSLLWREPGNETIAGESLGMSLLWREPGNESIVGRAWE